MFADWKGFAISMSHPRNAKLNPHMRPAPGLDARFAKKRPKTVPKTPPKIEDSLIETAKATPAALPPIMPSTRPVSASPNVNLCAIVVSAGIMWALFEIDRLHNVTWKEKFDCPINQHADFTFQPRELREIDPPPHEPSEEAGEANSSRAEERQGQFRASGLKPNDAERAQ